MTGSVASLRRRRGSARRLLCPIVDPVAGGEQQPLPLMDPAPPSSVRRPSRWIHPRRRAAAVRPSRIRPSPPSRCHPASRIRSSPPPPPAVFILTSSARPSARCGRCRGHLPVRPSRRPLLSRIRPLRSARRPVLISARRGGRPAPPSAVRAAPGLRFLCAARCRPPPQPPRVAPPLSRRAAGSAPACRRPRLQLLSGLQRPLLLHQLELFSASSASKHLDLPSISACLAILANQPASILWAAPNHCHLLPVAIAAACC